MTELTGSPTTSAATRAFFGPPPGLTLVEDNTDPRRELGKRPAADMVDLIAGIRAELEERSLAAETRRSYRSHQAAWTAWCEQNDRVAVPAAPEDLVDHLVDYAVRRDEVSGEAVRGPEGELLPRVAVVSVQVRLAAIDKLHEERGEVPPGKADQVQLMMRGLRRTFSVRPVYGKAPLMLADLRRMVASSRMPSLAVLRRRTIGLLKATFDVTPGQLARLGWADVELSPDQAVLALPATVKGGSPRTVVVNRTGQGACLFAHLLALRTLAPPNATHVFTQPDGTALTRQGIDQSLKKLGAQIGGWAGPRNLLVERVTAATAEGDREAEGCSTKALRDTALLTCGWFAALRRSNLVALSWRDLCWTDAGIQVLLRRSKRDQDGHGLVNMLPYIDGDPVCPASALTAWRDRVAEILGGDPVEIVPDQPVFVSMDRHGNLKRTTSGRLKRLRGTAVNELVQELAVRIGLTPRPGPDERNPYGGHSLRVGFVTEALTGGKLTIAEVQAVTHHGDVNTLIDYNKQIRPLNPLHPYYWAAWVCPSCAEDGDADSLIDGNRCPNCRAIVERLS